MNQLTRLAAATLALCATTLGAQAQIQPVKSGVKAAPAGATAAGVPVAPGQRVNAIAFLADKPLAVALTAARAPGAARKSVPWTAQQQRDYSAALKAKQGAVISAAQALGAEVLGQLTNASNGVLISIDAGQLGALAQSASVAGVMLVEDSPMALATTTAYVGANAVRSRSPSIDGTGVRVAVLDSGIDFTHYNLGGAGTVAAYNSAYGPLGTPTAANPRGCQPTPQNTSAPTFTGKVIGGYDFVGDAWPNAALAPDPNPIDCQGHGTNVSDIIAGRSADGIWQGMAPGAQLIGVKVCSAVATSCSGLAILQALDYALDPNQDGDLSDAVDVVNMSLGANFGQRENPSSSATSNVVRFGTVVAASAGNGGNVPYINGSPSSSPEAIAVAQTHVTGQFVYPLTTSPGGTTTNTTWLAWTAVPVADISGTLGVDTNLTTAGCAAYTPGFFAGQVALIRRGACSISTKVVNAAAAGALGVVIDDNVVAADPPPFSDGGDPGARPTSIVVTQAVGNSLRALAAPVAATIGFTNRISLNGSIVSSSSRGPNPGYSQIKPDIGAPGASVSARVGTGNGTSVFGGTSGAAPVVAGAAALVLQAHPTLQPHEVKARLMGAADNVIYTNPAALPGELAPITRIGAGEVRVVGAIDNSTVMWESTNPGANSLAFGYQPTSGNRVLRKRVIVRNYSSTAKTYTVGTSYRYADDQASGGVSLSVPATVSVPANSSTAFNVQMSINPAGLPEWRTTGVNGGTGGANGAILGRVEYDGYLTLNSGGETVRMPWHVMPRRAHNAVTASSVTLSAGAGTLGISNLASTTAAVVEVFALTGTSPQLPYASLPGPGDSFAAPDLRAAGVRGVNTGSGANSGAQFAVSRFDATSTPNQNLTVRVLIDTNQDGINDWQITASRSTGNQSLAFLQRLTSCVPATNCPSTAFFFTTADLNSSNWILTVPTRPTYGGTVQTVIDPALPFNFRVQGLDNYFTGVVSDTIGSMSYTLTAPRFVSAAGDSLSVPVGFSGTLPVAAGAGGAAGSPSQSGLLLMWQDGMPGREASVVPVN